MANNGPKYISFSTFRALIEQNTPPYDTQPYIGQGFVMIRNVLRGMVETVLEGMPFRFDDLRWGFVNSGEADVVINLQPYHVKVGDMFFIGTDSILEFNGMADDFNLQALVITTDLLNGWMNGHIPDCMQVKMTQFRIESSTEEQALLLKLFDTLWNAVHLTGDRSNVTGGVVNALVRFYESLFLKYSQNEEHQLSRERMIFQQFIKLVNQANGTQRRLGYYAQQMHLTQRYVGTVVKQVSDVTAKEWIDRSTIMRIKVLLRHSDMQITQIASLLNFVNDSFFNKYFKRITGLTPNEYRQGKDHL